MPYKMPDRYLKRPSVSSIEKEWCPICNTEDRYRGDTISMMHGNYKEGHQVVWCPYGHITFIRFEDRKQIIEFTHTI